MSDKIKRAEMLARFVHEGQKRQDGEKYINHCIRIVDRIQKSEWIHSYHNDVVEDIICVAWLHDAVEDCEDRYLMHNLIKSYFGNHVHDLVHTLTHWNGDYNPYIEKVSRNSQALQIKWADMIDNTSYPIPEKQRRKYRDACIHLQKKGVVVPDILLERLHIMIIRTCESCGKPAATIQHSDDFICKECVKKYGT